MNAQVRQKVNIPFKSLVPLHISAFLGIILSLTLFFVVRDLEQKRIEFIFAGDVEDRVSMLQKEIKDIDGIVQSLASFYNASNEVDREEFNKFTFPILKSEQYMSALMWLPRVSHQRRSLYENKAIREGFSNFMITERNYSGEMSKAGNRLEYFPIYFLEPFKNNDRIFGYDIKSDRVRFLALQQARNSGKMTISAPIDMIQDQAQGQKNGLLVLQPIYHQKIISKKEGYQRKNLMGFLGMIVEINRLVDHSMGYLEAKDIVFSIYDELPDNKNKVVYISYPEIYKKIGLQSTANIKKKTHLSIDKIFDVGGRRWRVEAVATPEYLSEIRLGDDWKVLVVGLLFTAMVIGYLWANLKHTREVEDQVFRRTLELLKANDQLKNRTDDLEKVNLELDSFVYTASHDLRAPLRGIASFAAFLEEDYKEKLDAEGQDYLKEIRKGADRLSQLIDDLLTLSRIARIKNPYEDVQAGGLIQNAIERLEFDIKQKNVDLKIQENLPTIRCDQIKLAEVFLNLINNAIKFSSKNEKENPRIEVGYQDTGNAHQFFIKDNGIGIDAQYHEKIFGVFKRLHKESEYEGTGAGLSIVKRVIDDHGGKIWVDSRLGEGATFYFSIPKNLKEKKKLGEILVEDGLLTKENLEKELKKQGKIDGNFTGHQNDFGHSI